jgi:hypothetical protein
VRSMQEGPVESSRSPPPHPPPETFERCRQLEEESQHHPLVERQRLLEEQLQH